MSRRPFLFATNYKFRFSIMGLGIVILLWLSLSSAPWRRQTVKAKTAFATITVNTTADTVAADGFCSLREAIQAANTNAAVNECPAGAAGLDTIQFNIGTGTPTINVTSALPTITQPIIINGNTGGATRVELNGVGAGASTTGLTISAGGSTVQALVINRFGSVGIRLQTGNGNTVKGCTIGLDAAGATDQGNTGNGIFITSANNIIGGPSAADRNVISGNNSEGVVINGATATNTLIQGNYIGTDINGMADLGNTLSGVLIDGAPNNTIGGATMGARNLISGNGDVPGPSRHGVGITNTGATGNLVQNNFIGVSVTGNVALGNSRSGVALTFGASNNTVKNNVLSANVESGVFIQSSNTTDNQVVGNLIGTNADGTAALGNGYHGVTVFQAPNNFIGGTTAAARNVISGNNNCGVTIASATAANNIVQGNFIGTDITGAVDLGNTGDGVLINTGAPNNTIGGTAVGARNVISGNNSDGIEINGATTTANLIQGNFIGTNAAGTAALGNSSRGVLITDAPNTTIGGTSSGAGNVISSNNSDGVIISGAASANNTVQGNFIGTVVNGTADLGNTGDGVRMDTGAHNNFIGGTNAGARNVISGNNSDGIKINGSTSTANQVQGNYIGTNAAGTAALGNSARGVFISGAPNNTIGGTAASAGNVISGNSPNNSDGVNIGGAASANNTVQGNYIGTDASGTADLGNAFDGVHIDNGAHDNLVGGTTASARNLISGNNSDGIEINGSASTANLVQGNFIGTNASGNAAVPNATWGVIIQSAPSTLVGGTIVGARNVISGNTQGGVAIHSTGADNNVVQGNLIGVGVTGTLDLGNTFSGVYTGDGSGFSASGFATNTTIGGLSAAARNVISGNNNYGVWINGSGATGNTVQGNYIGTDINGTADLGNTLDGVRIAAGAHDNIIGGTASGARNVISGNDSDGIEINGTGTTANQVQGSYIGTNAAGTSALGNTSFGVLVFTNANNNVIGGTAAGAGNLISGNTLSGVSLQGGANANQVLGNLIGTNAAGTAAIPNTNGVFIANAGNNLIGGAAAGAANRIAFNSSAGVSVTMTDATTTGNGILSNAIFSNAGLGIDLTAALPNDGITANDVGDGDTGPNNLQNFPVLLSVSSGGGNTTVQAALNSTASTTFRIELFSNPTCDASGNGEGQVFLGSTNVTTDASGNAAINAVLPGNLTPGHVVTMTATDPANNTSEFSQCVPRPDLQVSAANAPTEVFTDIAFNLTWTDINLGQASADAPWVDKIYLSTDNQFGNDVLLASFQLAQSLNVGQSVQRTQSISIPRSAVPADGSFFLLIFTDADNNVNEGLNESNNVRVVPVTARRTPIPDLTVTSIEAPDTAFFDQTITVRWTVNNAGNGSTNAGEWRDRVYLSLDTTPSGDDALQLDVVNISYLNAGDSYLASANVKLPRGLFGNYYLIVKADNSNNVLEDREDNNTRSKAINLQVPPLPDLQTTLVQAPDEAFAGQPMLLNWRVENRGTGNTPSDQIIWGDGIYLSQDQTLNTATDRFIAGRQHSGALVQNDGYTVSGFSVTLPTDIAGNWYVFVVADYQNAVYEFTNENNNSNYDAAPVLIHATPPDLIVPTATAPATGTAARQVTVNWTVRNQGAFDANPSWNDTVYLSNDATLDPATDTALGSVPRGALLGPGLSYSTSAAVTLPPCLTGTYYLFVYTDSSKQVFEFDPNLNAEQNNFSQALPIQLSAIPPDLQVSSVINPATGNAGQPLSLTWTVNNTGAGPTVEQSWIDRIYFSPTQTFDSATALNIGSFVRDGMLAQNASYTRTETITIPTTAQGPYYVFVFTDASDSVEERANDNNNSRSSATVITVTNNLPDLRITAINVPAGLQAGQTITVNWTGQNSGVIAAPSFGWNDVIYLSTDQTLDGNDSQLAAKVISGPLAVNATYQAQVQFTLPNVTPGSYYLIVKADDGNFVFEGLREDNNITTQAVQLTAPPVDLLVTAVDAPAQAFAGQQMLVSWTVNNAGTTPTSASQWTDAVILSRDQVLDATDLVAGYLVHNGTLANGASYNAMLNVDIPRGLTGIHFVFVRADRNNAVAETNENNNTLLDTTPANLQLPPPADLTVASINSPGAGSPGETATIQWTVNNVGSNTANGQWTDAVYLSSDQVWDINDMLVGRYEKSGPVLNGQSYTGSLTAVLPPVTPGSYYVIVRTDVRNRVFESNESNNTTASIGRTTIDVTALTLGVPRNSDIRTGQERYYKVNVPANETLLFTLDGQNPLTSNELYTRFGSLPSLSAFDFLFSKPYQPDQETLVPNTQAGNYFSLVRGAYVPPGSSPDPFSIKAEIVPFSITSVSPSRIGDNGQVTITIKGAKFKDDAAVKLVKGTTMLTPTRVWLIDSATLKARFLLSNAPHGTFDVVLRNCQTITWYFRNLASMLFV